MTRRIAVLVDGDNLSPAHAARIMAEAKKLGRVDVARVYGNASHPSDWMTAPGYRMIHAGCGKNAADVLLCIDAMELAMGGDWQGFVIASSDGDFVHLAQRLRERGLTVAGIGEAKAPIPFRLACSDFVTLASRQVRELIAMTGSPATRMPAIGASDFDWKIKTVIQANSSNGRGMGLTALANAMKNKHQTQISAFSETTWRGYLSKRPELYDLDPRGPDAMVRFKWAGFNDAAGTGAVAAE